MPPKKGKDSEDGASTPVRGGKRVPDYFDGDKGGLDNLLVLDKMSVTRPKGVWFATLQLVQSLNDSMTETWPRWLQPLAPAIEAAMNSDKHSEKWEKTRNVDVRTTLTLVEGADQLPIIAQRTVRLWKAKVVAKPGDAEVRWYLQLSGEYVGDLGGELFRLLGSYAMLETDPVQQTLGKKPADADDGDDLVQ